MTNVWFTSDTHFSHPLVARKRGYSDLLAHDRDLINCWNARVQPHDTVYHLGDVGFAKPEELRKLVDKLNGNIMLILGNHDKTADHPLVRGRFGWVKDYAYIRHEGTKIVLCHYPMITWHSSHHGSWQLFGHCHGNLKVNYGRQMDVGVDTNQYMPYHFYEIRKLMELKFPVIVDHHGVDPEEA